MSRVKAGKVEELPENILVTILSFLPLPSLLSARLVCKRMRGASVRDEIWRNLFHSHNPSLPPKPNLSHNHKQYIDGQWYDYYKYEVQDRSAEWEFSQMFGEEESDSDEEIDDGSTDNYISSLSFDSTGDFLAVGYNCGQIVVLKQQDDDSTYQLYTEFKSHDAEFDFLTSMEIEEKINMIRWFPFSGREQLMLTCNDKTIKLFKMSERVFNDGVSFRNDVHVVNKKTFEGGHAYNINSIAFNSDGETWISSDDLRINLWNISIASEAFGVVDIKPENMDDLTEVITTAAFHPHHCHVMTYATSKGAIRLGDMRNHALCDTYAKVFEESDTDIGGFFQELVTTISDIKFSRDGRFVVSRDYLTMKVWDLRKEDRPIKTVKFHDHLIGKLCDLYENDSIFDKFECCWGYNDFRLLTGSYNNQFYICDVLGEDAAVRTLRATKPGEEVLTGGNAPLDSSQKVLHVDWHPQLDLIALGAKDFGYLYQKKEIGEGEEESD